jgi:putative methyltransferase (TIGR04325 family)
LRPADGSLLATNVLYLTALALGQPDLAVTDFGGACGELGRDFLTVFPQARYTVVENPVLVALMAKSGGGVQFTATPPAECDLFFSSSTLQYLEDPMAALAAGFSSARRAVIFARNSFCDTDLIRVQQSWLFDNGNGPLPPGYENVKVFYPHRTLNENAVLQSAQKHGFRCVARIEERSGVIPYRDMVYGRQLVFLRAAS